MGRIKDELDAVYAFDIATVQMPAYKPEQQEKGIIFRYQVNLANRYYFARKTKTGTTVYREHDGQS